MKRNKFQPFFLFLRNSLDDLEEIINLKFGAENKDKNKLGLNGTEYLLVFTGLISPPSWIFFQTI